ncbi:MAG: pyridoxal phosphate-dependent aminotransferase [Holosporales bacterium]
MSATAAPIVNFSQGVPDAALCPDFFRTAAQREENAELRAKNIGYCPDNAGLIEVRRAVADSFNLFYRPTARIIPQQVMLASGCTSACVAAMRHYEEYQRSSAEQPIALLQSPTYHFYKKQLHQLGVPWQMITMPDVTGLSAAQRLTPIINALTLYPGRDILLVLNTPANPTGDVYPPAFTEKLAELLKNNPSLSVLEDTIYERLVFADGVTPTSVFAAVSSDDAASRRVYHASGLSKAWAFPAGRLGYLIGHPEVIQDIDNAQDLMVGQMPIDSQLQLLTALTKTDELCPGYHKAFNDYLRHNAAQLLALLEHMPALRIHPPQAGIYGFVQGDESAIKALHAASKQRGLLFPGVQQFGEPGLRFNIAVHHDTFAAALQLFSEAARAEGILIGQPPELNVRLIPVFNEVIRGVGALSGN